MKTLANLHPDTPLLIVNEWDESQHPRDEAGKFTEGGGGGGGRSGSAGELSDLRQEIADIDHDLSQAVGLSEGERKALSDRREKALNSIKIIEEGNAALSGKMTPDQRKAAEAGLDKMKKKADAEAAARRKQFSGK